MMDPNIVFPGDSEMAVRCRSIDWGTTALGPVERWPEALRVVVRTAIETPFPINLWCGRDLVLIYNDAYVRLLGEKHPAALGRPGSRVWHEIWPEIRQMFADAGTFYQEDTRFLMQRRGQEPEEAWFTFSVSPIRDEAGAVVAYLNIAAETTQRMQLQREADAARVAAERAEARLQEVFAQAPVAVCVLRGEDLVYELANPLYQQFFPGRALRGLPIREALPELAGQGVFERLEGVMRTGVPYVATEFPIGIDRTGGGTIEEAVFSFVYQPIRDEDGNVDGIAVVAIDVTELVQSRRTAEAAKRTAEEANRAKTEFLRMMSHELRTPLNAIAGYAELLSTGVYGRITDGQEGALERIRTSQRHLLGLINTVLNFARLEAGAVDYDIQPVAVDELVREVGGLVAVQAQASGLSLDLPDRAEAGTDGRLVALADPEKLRQVLFNLLSNAVKFTPRGGRIRVSCRGDHRQVSVEVADTGRGIDGDQLDHIFEPFVQLGRDVRSSHEGTGLGLAISRELARAMGGDLLARSEPGRGSTFTVVLPTANGAG